MEMRDLVGLLETVVDNSVDHDYPPGCAKMLRDIVFACTVTCYGRCRATHLHVGNPVAIWRHSGASVVRVNPPSERNRLSWSAQSLAPNAAQ